MPNGWGTDCIPKEQWIDPSKTYKTAGGKRVINLNMVLKNSLGNEVTYPIKGTIVEREKPLKKRYAIWSLDGKADVVWGNRSDDDLVEVAV